MGLRHAVLAALVQGEASGYQLAKRFDVSVANFWAATPQQLYRELERLEAEGLLSGRAVEQQRRPTKRVFTVTAAGREELHVFIASPTRPTALRDDLLVKLQAADDDADLAAVRSALNERRAAARQKLALYDHLRDGLLRGRTEEEHVSQADRIGPFLTLLGGRMFEEQNLAWCHAALEVLDRRQQSTRSEATGTRSQDCGAAPGASAAGLTGV